MAKETIAIVIEGQDNASDDLRRVQQNMSNLSSQSQRTAGGMKNFAGGINMSTLAMGGMAAAGIAAAQQLANITLELNQLGAVTTQTQNVFEALSGELKSSSSLLENLRKSTKGIVSDTALMQGANQLMRMGLAENSAEVEQLIDMAVKLKQPTDTAAEAVDNFAMMLANQSVERLDSFGISSAKVRAEIEKLIETGQALNREEAFKMAVLDLGADAIANLGSAVDESATEVAKLETRWQNFLDTVGQDVNANIEVTARFINDIIEVTETPEGQQRYILQTTGGTFAGGIGGGRGGVVAPNTFMNQDLEEEFRQAEIRRRMQQVAINQLRGLEYIRAVTQADQEFLDTMAALNELRADAEQLTLDAAEAVAFGMINITPDFMSDPYLSTNLESINQELDLYMQQLLQMEEAGADVGDMKLQVEQLSAVWDGVTNAVNGSVAALERLQGLSLDDLLGRGAGDPQQAGLVEMLLGNIDNSELRSRLQSEFALLTGQDTELAQVVENEISPEIARIAKSMGAEVSFGMVEAVQNALQTGEFLGMSDDDIIQLVRDAVRASTPGPMPAPAGTGGAYTVQPGDSPWSILANMGIPSSEIQAMLGMFAPYGTLQPGMQIGLPGMGGVQPVMPYQNIFGQPTDFPSFLSGEDGGALQPIESLISEQALEEVDTLQADFIDIDQKMRTIQSTVANTFRNRTMNATVNIDVNVSGNEDALNYVLGERSLNNLQQNPQHQPGSAPPSGVENY